MGVYGLALLLFFFRYSFVDAVVVSITTIVVSEGFLVLISWIVVVAVRFLGLVYLGFDYFLFLYQLIFQVDAGLVSGQEV